MIEEDKLSCWMRDWCSAISSVFNFSFGLLLILNVLNNIIFLKNAVAPQFLFLFSKLIYYIHNIIFWFHRIYYKNKKFIYHTNTTFYFRILQVTYKYIHTNIFCFHILQKQKESIYLTHTIYIYIEVLRLTHW